MKTPVRNKAYREKNDSFRNTAGKGRDSGNVR